LEHKASATIPLIISQDVAKSLEKMHRKKRFLYVLGFTRSKLQYLISFLPSAKVSEDQASRLQATAGHPFWASQHEEVSGFTNFALSPALAPLS